MIKIVQNKIDTVSILESVHSDSCGASVLFIGTTRKTTDGRETARLEYECYEQMAVDKMDELCRQAKTTWPIEKITVVHRVGTVEIGETSIAIAVSSPHRRTAFEAAQWLIDELKKVVPIWKKEHWADGATEWVHPGRAASRLVEMENEVEH